MIRLPRYHLSELFLLLTLGTLQVSFYAGVLRTISERYYINEIVISPDAALVAFDSTRGLLVSDLQTGRHKLIRRSSAGAPSFSSDVARLVFVEDGHALVWDTESWSCLREFPAADQPRMTAFSAEGHRLLIEDYGTVHIFRSIDGMRIASYVVQLGFAHSILANGDLSLMAYNDGLTIGIWDVAAQRQVRTFGKASACHPWLSDDGKTIAFGVDDGVQMWDSQQGMPIFSITAQEPVYTAFSSSGRLLGILTYDGLVHVINLDSRAERTFGQLQPGNGAIAFTQNGKRLAAADEHGHGMIWDVESGELVSAVSGLNLSPPVSSRLWWILGVIGVAWLLLWWRIHQNRALCAADKDKYPGSSDLGWHFVYATALVVVGNGLSVLQSEVTVQPIQLVAVCRVVEYALLIGIVSSLFSGRCNVIYASFTVVTIIGCIIINHCLFGIAAIANA